jgi:acyl-homoserine lactone acylase PvdQ
MRKPRDFRIFGVLVLAMPLLSPATLPADPGTTSDNFQWMRGANCVPLHAATDVEMWLRYWRAEYGNLHPEAFGENEAFGAPKTETELRDAVKALHAAADYLKSHFGSPLAPWGQLLRLRHGDLDLPLDGDVGFFGGIECRRATGTDKPDKTGRFVFNGGQVIPTDMKLTDPIQVWSIVPYGQSRRPGSRHYADQAHLYSEGRMGPAWHTWSQLRDHVESVKVIEYRSRTP